MSDGPEQGIGTAEHTHRMPRKRAAATVLFTDGAGRVLLCEPTYKQVWEAPGGAVEADESPRRAVRSASTRSGPEPDAGSRPRRSRAGSRASGTGRSATSRECRRH